MLNYTFNEAHQADPVSAIVFQLALKVKQALLDLCGCFAHRINVRCHCAHFFVYLVDRQHDRSD